LDAIYKVFREQEWSDFERSLLFTGSADDIRDGYVHFSTRTQLDSTIQKYFSDVDTIIVALVDTDALKTDLKWEVSTKGQLYPHLYSPLPYSTLKKINSIQRRNGRFDLAALDEDA